MNDLTAIIGHNLSQLRHQQHLTLDTLAERSGVSKAMIGQIERGESNPTVNTLWKIATGLQVPLGTLLSQEEPSAILVEKAAVTPIEDHLGLTVYPLFSFSNNKSLEIFLAVLAPAASHASDPHALHSIEYILVSQGTLTMQVGEQTFSLSAGDALQIQGDCQHSYHNPTDMPVEFYCILHHTKT